LITKIEEIYKQWRSVSLTQMRNLQDQKDKTNAQMQQLRDAQNSDNKAKAQLEEANVKVHDAKIALENAKTDTEQARREAEELRQQLEDAERERAEAREKEKQTRDWVSQISKDKDFYEQEYNKLKVQSASFVGGVLNDQQRESGFESKSDDFLKLSKGIFKHSFYRIHWPNIECLHKGSADHCHNFWLVWLKTNQNCDRS
jgi:chromosome segregation ATPase